MHTGHWSVGYSLRDRQYLGKVNYVKKPTFESMSEPNPKAKQKL